MILYAQVINQNHTQIYDLKQFKILFLTTLTLNYERNII
jgi:hypothetical protein